MHGPSNPGLVACGVAQRPPVGAYKLTSTEVIAGHQTPLPYDREHLLGPVEVRSTLPSARIDLATLIASSPSVARCRHVCATQRPRCPILLDGPRPTQTLKAWTTLSRPAPAELRQEQMGMSS